MNEEKLAKSSNKHVLNIPTLKDSANQSGFLALENSKTMLTDVSNQISLLISNTLDDESPLVLASLQTTISSISAQMDLIRSLLESNQPNVFEAYLSVVKQYRSLLKRTDKALSFIENSREETTDPLPTPGSRVKDQAKLCMISFMAEESEYLRHLDLIVNTYMAKLQADEILSKADESKLFSCMTELIEIHQHIIRELKAALRNYPDSGLGVVMKKFIPEFNRYSAISVNASDSNACLDRLVKENKAFASLLKSMEKDKVIPLRTLLTRPLHRLEEYFQQLDEYSKLISPVSPDRHPVEEAKDLLQDLLDAIEQRGSQADNLSRVMEIGLSIEGLEENLVRPDRKFLFEGPLTVCTDGQKKPVGDYAFMFNDVLLYTQSGGKTHKYIGQIWIHALNIDTKAAPIKDGINVIVNSKEKFVLTSPSKDAIKEWILNIGKAIRDVERTRKVFGVPLKVLMKRETDSDVPMLVEKVIKFIYDYGINKQGLFRQTGRSTQIEKLKDQLNQGKKVFFSENMDVHSVADLFKQWLRELPEPLLTWEAYPKCVAAIEAAGENHEQLVTEISQIIDGLPRANKNVVQHLIKCLKAVCDNEEKTKMNPGNLAVVFAPNILKNGDPSANPFDMKYFEIVNEVFKLLIVHYEDIFCPIEMKRTENLQKKSKTPEKRDKEKRRSVRSAAKGSLGTLMEHSSAPSISSSTLTPPEAPKKVGTLMVQGKKKWSNRFVLIQGASMCTFKGQKEKKAKAKFNLLEYQVGLAPSSAKPFSFALEALDGTKTIFAAKTTEEQESWMSIIRETISILE